MKNPSSTEARALDADLPEIDWAVIPAEVARFEFAAPSGPLAAIRSGDPKNPRVVLIPGITGSKEDFILMFPLLVDAGYYVESFDLAGQYESFRAGPKQGERYTWASFEADVRAFLAAGKPAHVVGYSFSGLVVNRVALERPELFMTIALMSVPPDAGNGFKRVKIIGKVSWAVSPRVRAALMLWGVRSNLNGASRARARFAKRRMQFTVRVSVTDAMNLMGDIPDIEAQLAALPQPKLVITGQHDLWPVEVHGEFARRIGAELKIYETGHSPCEETPHQLTRDLVALYRSSS